MGTLSAACETEGGNGREGISGIMVVLSPKRIGSFSCGLMVTHRTLGLWELLNNGQIRKSNLGGRVSL